MTSFRTFLFKLRRLLLALPIVALVLMLCSFGICVIYSATFTNDSLKDSYTAQIKYGLFGIFLLFTLAMVDYRILVKYVSPVLFGTALLLLIACFIPGIGKKVFGAYSWIRIFGIGFEPGDFAKLSFILFFAGFLDDRNWGEINSWEKIVLSGIFVGIPFALLGLQPAWGSALVFAGIALGMLFIAGIRVEILGLPILAVVLSISLLYWWVMVKQWDIRLPFFKTEHVVDRVRIFFDPSLDPKGKAWQVNQSVIAISTGGLEGKGWCKGTQNLLGYLPRNTSYNDLIFSVIGEEQGFYGGCALIVGQGVLLLWCLGVVSMARDRLGQLVAVGVMSMLFTHVFVNVGMTMQLVPIIGIPLPFTSYGGTFLVSCLAAIGLVISVWVHRTNPERK